MWLTGAKWSDLVLSDFLTLMPIKHFNNLEKPFRLPDECYPFMYYKTQEYISMWVDCKNYDYKPSDFRENNEILGEDLRVFDMLETMKIDADKYNKVKVEQEAENKAYIEREKEKFRNSKRYGNR